MRRDSDEFRSVRVAAPDDSLVRALAEHRKASHGWSVGPLEGPPEPDALVILDFDDGDARTRMLDRVRTEGFGGPVVILGGCDAARSPADEALPRPVRLGALLGRIDAHGAAPAEPDPAMLGPYQFAPDERLLRDVADGRIIRLTELEQDLLVYLAAAQGALVGRDQLLADVWGYSDGVDSHTVETHVWRLRQKIETDDPATRFLVTEAGGYRLLGAGARGV
jgi:DNA-binding response OmpR family regulator